MASKLFLNLFHGYIDAHFWWICSFVMRCILESLSSSSLHIACFALHLLPHGDTVFSISDVLSWAAAATGDSWRWAWILMMSSPSSSSPSLSKLKEISPVSLLDSSSEWSSRVLLRRHWFGRRLRFHWIEVPPQFAVSSSLSSSSSIPFPRRMRSPHPPWKWNRSLCLHPSVASCGWDVRSWDACWNNCETALPNDCLLYG